MNGLLSYAVQDIDLKLLATVILTAVVLGLVLAVWVSKRQRTRDQHLQMNATDNVIQMRKPRPKHKLTRLKHAKSYNSFGPLLLVGLAGILAVLFRSNIWFEVWPSQVLTGTVTHVRDGDTIVVSGRPIRLNGLTCDERRTPLGDQATAAMVRLVSGQTVACELNGDRTYDREVGRCSLKNGQDIGAFMITQGLCGRCANYDPLRKYASVQRDAGPFVGSYPEYCWALW